MNTNLENNQECLFIYFVSFFHWILLNSWLCCNLDHSNNRLPCCDVHFKSFNSFREITYCNESYNFHSVSRLPKKIEYAHMNNRNQTNAVVQWSMRGGLFVRFPVIAVRGIPGQIQVIEAGVDYTGFRSIGCNKDLFGSLRDNWATAHIQIKLFKYSYRKSRNKYVKPLYIVSFTKQRIHIFTISDGYWWNVS